jgi:hypothetical protein
MSAHEQFGEDLALYALDCLESDKRIALEKHLEECAPCRHELEAARTLSGAADGCDRQGAARTRTTN